MYKKDRENILKLLDEIDAEIEICCSTTMEPDYIEEQTLKIREILRNYE